MAGIGQMRDRAKIYSITTVPDGIGGTTNTRVFDKEVWAKVVQGTWTKAEGQQTVPISLQMRTGSYNLTTRNIVEFRGRDYTVISVTTDDKRRLTTAQLTGNG